MLALISPAALLAIFILVYLSSSDLAAIVTPDPIFKVSFSILFSSLIPSTTLST
jgi:hypothetical protein